MASLSQTCFLYHPLAFLSYYRYMQAWQCEELWYTEKQEEL